jgi:hypothetical protein
VVCVLTKTDIAGDEEGREDLFQFLDSEDDRPIEVICWRACGVLYGVVSVRQLFQHEATKPKCNLVTIQWDTKKKDALQA